MRHGHFLGGDLLKDPRHPPAPAFEQASNRDEHRRQQLIAALTPAQRQAFDELRARHEAAAKELAERQENESPGKIAERMRDHLLQDRAPHLRPETHKHQLKDKQELSYAAKDFLEGKETRATQKHRHELHHAHNRAKDDVTREHGQQRRDQRDGQQRERDDFLKQAQKERAQEKTQKDFEKAARDPSWQRAFNRAAQKEADHHRDNPHDHDKHR